MLIWLILLISFSQLRPPQPSVFLFLLDVSFNALETGWSILLFLSILGLGCIDILVTAYVFACCYHHEFNLLVMCSSTMMMTLYFNRVHNCSQDYSLSYGPIS